MPKEKKEIEFSLKSLTDEQIQKLKNIGFDIKEEWACACPFCGKEFKRKTEKQASRSLSNHLGKCKIYQFTKTAKDMMPNPKKFKIGDLVYLLTGKFPKNYKPHKDNKEALKTIKIISKNMEKK